jgi:hypothetical protein
MPRQCMTTEAFESAEQSCRLVSVASAAVMPATAAEVAFHHGPRFVNGQGAAVQLRAIQLRDRFLSVVIGHRYESEALRAARIAIRNDAYCFHRTAMRKSVRNIVLSRLERQVSNKNFL